MNSRERLLRTIAGKPTDRPPVAPFLHVNFIKEHRRRHDVDLMTETVRVYREFDFDMVHRNCTPEYDDLLRKATPDAVRHHAADLIATARGRGRFVLGTSDYINENTPVENLRALREAVNLWT